jgi:uncharacterized protein YehS (DUF1456 family)
MTTGLHTTFQRHEDKIVSIINSCETHEQVESCENWLRRIDPSPYYDDELVSAYIAGLIRMKRCAVGGAYEPI